MHVGMPFPSMRLGVPAKNPSRKKAELEKGGHDRVSRDSRICRKESTNIVHRASPATSRQIDGECIVKGHVPEEGMSPQVQLPVLACCDAHGPLLSGVVPAATATTKRFGRCGCDGSIVQSGMRVDLQLS